MNDQKTINNLVTLLTLSIILSSLTACQSLSKTSAKVGEWVGLGKDEVKTPKIDKKGVTDLSKKNQQQLQQLLLNMPVDQWIYMEDEKKAIYQLKNKNQAGQFLNLKLHCKVSTQTPSLNVEDSANKQILNSLNQEQDAIQVLLDDRNYGNPFQARQKEKLDQFKIAITIAKEIKIFQASKLYRFQNNNLHLLDKAVSCVE